MLRLRNAAAAALLAWLVAGCSGLSPQKPGVPPSTIGCGEGISVFKPLTNGVGPVATDTTLDLATWNLRFFPTTNGGFECPDPVNSDRVNLTAQLINTLDLDVIAVEEISNLTGWQDLLTQCPAYDGVLVTLGGGCNFQRTGIIYKKSVVTVNSYRAVRELTSFTRDPLEADLTASQSGHTFHFRLMVVHLKAGSGYTDRRREETDELHMYLDQQAALQPDLDYVVAGDWNDVLTDPVGSSSFPSFLTDQDNYSFVTDPLKDYPGMASIGSGSSILDQILVNKSACPDFAGSRVSTLRLDLMVNKYSSLVSDHRPVMVQVPVFK